MSAESYEPIQVLCDRIALLEERVHKLEKRLGLPVMERNRSQERGPETNPTRWANEKTLMNNAYTTRVFYHGKDIEVYCPELATARDRIRRLEELITTLRDKLDTAKAELKAKK